MAESLEREIQSLRSLFESERDPEGRAFVPLADAYRRGGELGRALQVVSEGMARHPDFASAHVVAAWIHQDRGDGDAAARAWARVLELDPDNLLALRGLGLLHLQNDRFEAGLELLERALELDPGNGELLERIEEAGSSAPPTAAAPDPMDVPVPVPAEPPEALAEVVGNAPDPGTEPESGDDPRVGERNGQSEAVLPSEEAPPLAPAGGGAFRADGEIVHVWADGGDEFSGEEEPPELPATRTLAELYARQGLHARAAEMYERLVEAHPEDPIMRERLEELRRERPGGGLPAPSPGGADDETEVLAREMSTAAASAEAATPFAWGPIEVGDERPGEWGGRPVSVYLKELLEWEPGRGPAVAEAPAEEHGEASGGAVLDVAPVAEAPSPGWVEGEVEEDEQAAAVLEVPPVGEALVPEWVEADVEDDESAAVLEVAPVGEAPAPEWIEAAVEEGEGEASGAVFTEVAPEDDVAQAPAAADVVPVTSLAPDGIVPIEDLAPHPVVPIASLAPDVVAIERLAPDSHATGPRRPSS